MKYAVYYQTEDETECHFFKTEEEAKASIRKLIKDCEDCSVNEEKNLHWNITLLKVIGECNLAQDGLKLEVRK